MSESKGHILTFGYGNRKDYDKFLSSLEQFEVSYVIDVRLKPRAWSRKWYGDAIAKFCDSHNICYFSKSALGNTSGCQNWVPPNQEEAEQSLAEVADLLHQGNVLLLCAELDSARCHRVEVAQKLQALTQASIHHLL